MGFSWVTFIAQIVNLFVLVWLLKRFLYRPIVDTIAKRQAYIEDKVKKAEHAAETAQQEQRVLEEKHAVFEAEKQKRLDEAFREIEHLKKEQEERIGEELKSKRVKMQADLNRETSSLQLEIRDLMARHFLELSRKVLVDLSGLSPVEQAVLLFRKKIEKLNSKDKEKIKNIYSKQKIISISVSDTLTKKASDELTDFIRKTFKADPSVRICIEKNSDLILGAEMTVGDMVVEWNLKSYLEAFTNNLNTALSGLIIKE